MFLFWMKATIGNKTFMQDRRRKSRWFESKICSMLFTACIPVEQEVIVTVIMIEFSIFTCFWCTPTQIQSKPSSNFALRHVPPKLVYKTLAHKRRGSYPVFERLIDYAADNAKAGIPPRAWKMFGFYFIKRFWNPKVTNLRMFHPSSLHKMWKWLCIGGNEATIYSHHGCRVKWKYLSPQLNTTVG